MVMISSLRSAKQIFLQRKDICGSSEKLDLMASCSNSEGRLSGGAVKLVLMVERHEREWIPRSTEPILPGNLFLSFLRIRVNEPVTPQMCLYHVAICTRSGYENPQSPFTPGSSADGQSDEIELLEVCLEQRPVTRGIIVTTRVSMSHKPRASMRFDLEAC